MEILPTELVYSILDFCPEIPLRLAAVCSLWRNYLFQGKSFQWLISKKIHLGDLPFLQRVLNERTWEMVTCRKNLVLLAKRGHVHIFNWLDELRPPYPKSLMEERFNTQFRFLVLETAIRKGQIAIIEALSAKGYFEYKGHQLSFFKLAAKHGRIDMIEWAEKRQFYRTSEGICQIAARAGQFETLKWLRQKNYPWNYRTSYDAARLRHEEIVQWTIENGCERRDCVFLIVIEACSLNLVRWMWEQNYPVDLLDAVPRACQGGKIDTANWLVSQGFPLDQKRCLETFAFIKSFEKDSSYIYGVGGKWA